MPERPRCLPHFVVAALALLTFPAAAQQEDETMIEDGSDVAFEYTLSLDDGSVVESNIGNEALSYTQGQQQILPALESELEGLKAGDEKKVTLAAVDAYGTLQDDAFREVPLENIPQDARTEGTMLSSPGYEGSIRVHEVRDETVVLDFNHPLAGQSLTFDIRIISVE